MCGSSSDTIPVPASKVSLPTRHQIRNAIRKVARTMRTKANGVTTNGTMDSWDFVHKSLRSGGWDKLSSADYDKAYTTIDKAVKASTFFNKADGICGSVKLTLRKTAKL